ncbi:MAG: peptide ABC transporter substrate-binding protein [Pseudomonadales bacterium]|nr:peptide ABC transporter substrate-binding protein [Pseudomonadales bacterium]MCP5182354.1 peptide ABC transporter substrate-binding protein [Pseudomonadales bacterium]
MNTFRFSALLRRLRTMLALLSFAALPAFGADTLNLGLPGEPATLDPHRYNLRIEETVLEDLFLGLTTFSAEGKLMPGAAESWETSEDGLTWTFHLRADNRWSDGTPLTAADFVWSFQRLLNPRTAASLAYFMYPLRNAEAISRGEAPVTALGAEARDDATLVLTLEKPYPHLPERLLYPTAFPVPRHVIEKVGDSWVKPQNWVSNGAYVLHDWKPQQNVQLVRNRHFQPPPIAGAVIYHSLASAQNAYNRYRAGDLDAIAGFPAGELETVKASRGAELRLSPQLSMMYLVFNTRRPPFDDRRVREALAIVVRPDILTDRVMRTGDLPAGSFVPSMVENYEHPALPHASLSLAERQQRAKQLLAAAGYGPDKPLHVTLRYADGGDGKRVNLATAAFWQQLGIKVDLHQAELKVHYADLRQGDFDVAQAGWLGESNPEHYLGLLHGRTGETNYGGYANAAVDALIDQAREQKAIAPRHALLHDAEMLAMQDYPVLPLYSLTVRRLVRAELRGWIDNTRDAHPARFLQRP